MADTKEAESKRREPAKKGLHGWRAALAVFGCGTLAAFGVFGIIVILLSTFISTVSEGVSPGGGGSPPPVAGTGEPREEFLGDTFDPCRIIDSITTAGFSMEENSEPMDSAIGGGPSTDDDLVRTGECTGSISLGSGAFNPLDAHFSYRSIIFHPEDGKDDISRSDMESWKSGFEASGRAVDHSGELDMLDEGYYYYADLGDGSGSSYYAVARLRSSVVSFDLTSPDNISATVFEGAVLRFENRLAEDLNGFVPE